MNRYFKANDDIQSYKLLLERKSLLLQELNSYAQAFYLQENKAYFDSSGFKCELKSLLDELNRILLEISLFENKQEIDY